jgi:hypothetical protein
MARLGRTALLAATALALLGIPAPCEAADPTTSDCLAANESSIALRNDHKLRAARAQLLVCAARSCPADVRKECVRRVTEVNAAMPTVVFEAKDGSGNDLTAVRVLMDGEPLAERIEGMALSIDPGEHEFTFEAAGQASVRKRFVIREGEKDRRERIVITAPPPAIDATPAAPAPAPTQGSGAAPAAGGSGLGGQRVAALVVGGVGVLGVVLGSAFGLQAISKRDSAAQACPERCADPSGVSMWHDAGTAGNVSTAAFVLGGAALAGAAVLWLTGRPSGPENRAAAIAVGPGGVTVRGRW